MLVVGHSFINRLRRDRQVQIAPEVEVKVIAEGGAYIRGRRALWYKVEQELAKGGYGAIVFQLGNNDIDRARHRSEMAEIVHQYVSIAEDLCARYQVIAVLCTEVPRGEANFPQSFEKTNHFNSLLKEVTESGANVQLFQHKGLHKRQGYLLQPDNIHPNKERGTTRFECSLKRAMRQAARSAWGPGVRY